MRAVPQRSILSVTLTRIVAYLHYLQRHLTQTIVAAVLPLILYSTYYRQRFAVEHCLFAFLHVPTVVSNRLMLQVDKVHRSR